MVEKYDVIVVGAGPAGSVAAWKAAKGGANTLLIEKAKLPRYKLCGGAVAQWIIQKFDIPEDAIENKGRQMIVCRPPKYKFEKYPVPAWQGMVLRDKFDYHLTKRAEEAGVEIINGTRVQSIIKEGDYVKGVQTAGDKYLSDIVIGCDGAASMTARTAGFWKKWFDDQGTTWKEHMAFCMGAEMKMDNKLINERLGEGNLYFFVGRKVAPLGYGWIFPKDDMLSIGLGSHMKTFDRKPSEYMKYFITEHPIASGLLADAEMVRLQGAYIPYKKAFKPSFDNGIMLAGDSAGMVNPINGEGIFYAMRAGVAAGEVAAEAVKAKDFSAGFLKRYEDRWSSEIGKHLDKQGEIFESNVGVALERIEKEGITDEEKIDKLFVTSFMEAFIGFIQYQVEYVLKKKGLL